MTEENQQAPETEVEQDSAEPQRPETLEIEDLDMFVRMLHQWHTGKVQLIQHMLTIPEGTEMIVGDDKSVTLTGDVLAGFKAGLDLALMELGTLPFIVEVEVEVDTAEDASGG
jgi:hypothetical protein